MRFPHRRQFLHLAAGAAALPALSLLARAQAYPSRPVRIIVAVAAGSAMDILARLMGQWLSERLGQQFVIENRPGGGNNIGTEAAVRAPADGYTLLMVNTVNAINATLYEKLNYNFIRDIAPVASIARAPFVMEVHPLVPARTVPEFIAYAKANPGKINMASSGTGSLSHMCGELFKAMAEVDMVHVPYRSSFLPDLFSGQVHIAFAPISQTIEYIRTDKLRALAVTAAKRVEALPDVPTVADFVPGYEASGWYGIGAPRNTPTNIVEKLNKEISVQLSDPKTIAQLADIGAVPMPMLAIEFGSFITSETAKWAKVIKLAGIKAE